MTTLCLAPPPSLASTCQDNTAEAVEQLKVSAKLQLEAHKAAMQQQLEVGGGSRSSINCTLPMVQAS